MQEELIKQKTAVLAKERRFNIYQSVQYSQGVNPTTTYNYTEEQCKLFKDTYYAPTQSLLQKWLREIHSIDIEIQGSKPNYSIFIPNKEGGWIYESLNRIKYFREYEEALEEGLIEALKLIKYEKV